MPSPGPGSPTPEASAPQTPRTIAALIGSLRADSFNRAVAGAAAELAPDGCALVEAPITDVPLFNQDVEAAGDPAPVIELKRIVGAADGLIIFTPEYNRSIPGVTKNAIDWLSRPVLEGPLVSLPVGIVAASPGRGDAAGARAHVAHTVAGAGGDVYPESLGIASVSRTLTDGRLNDETTRTALADWLDGFLAFVAAARAGAGG